MNRLKIHEIVNDDDEEEEEEEEERDEVRLGFESQRLHRAMSDRVNRTFEGFKAPARPGSRPTPARKSNELIDLTTPGTARKETTSILSEAGAALASIPFGAKTEGAGGMSPAAPVGTSNVTCLAASAAGACTGSASSPDVRARLLARSEESSPPASGLSPEESFDRCRFSARASHLGISWQTLAPSLHTAYVHYRSAGIHPHSESVQRAVRADLKHLEPCRLLRRHSGRQTTREDWA